MTSYIMHTTMKYMTLIIILIGPQTILANDGKELHEMHCIECHSRMTGGDGHVIYTRDDRIAKNMSELQARVGHCSNGSSTTWSESEINKVTEYLNNQYYHY